MSSIVLSTRVLALALAASLAASACGRQPGAASDTKVTEIPQTDVKMQSIGNCWAYAFAGWIESMHLQATGKKINVSETYISYWASYHEIIRGQGKLAQLGEGGSWELARGLTLDLGFLEEGDFIPEEALESFSKRQDSAVAAINKQLKPGGRLHGAENFNDQNIIKELDAAFGVDGLAAKARAKSAKDLVVGAKDGQPVTLANVLQGRGLEWTEITFPQKKGLNPFAKSVDEQRLAVIRRIQKALNDKMPVLISFHVGMNLIDPVDGMFKMSRYTGTESLGQTGRHMVVLTDYAVDDVPGVGSIGEGDVSAELKHKALEGRVRYFVAKNSWGTNRAERGLTDGYSRFDLAYLTTTIPWPQEGKKPLEEAALTDVVLPPGY